MSLLATRDQASYDLLASDPGARPVTVAAPSLTTEICLGMMQLAPSGLSEQWFLRLCGDRHWSLIAEAMGQEQAVFTDESGRPIYAAFCATSAIFNPAEGALLGQTVRLSSALFEVSGAQIGSVHQIRLGGKLVAELRMISTFVGHDESGSNHRILRRQPRVQISLPPAPAVLQLLASTARQQARSLRRDPVACPAAQPATTTFTPCPSLDFNAVGLLYFPSFSRMAEQTEWRMRREMAALARRDVFYLGNLEPGESVTLHAPDAALDVWREDGRIIARILTHRHSGGAPV